MKDEVWTKLATRCTATGTDERTSSELNKKFRNMKTEVKHKVAAEKKSSGKTGGGPPLCEVSYACFI